MNTKIKQIKPMMCPVCNKYKFSKILKKDLQYGDRPNMIQCPVCGWYYDLEQFKDPQLKKQSNALSLNEYKEQYMQLIKDNPNYIYESISVPKPHPCPCCEKYIFPDTDSFDICPYCGWEDDGFYEGGGANELNLEEHRKQYLIKIKNDPKYKWYNPRKK